MRPKLLSLMIPLTIGTMLLTPSVSKAAPGLILSTTEHAGKSSSKGLENTRLEPVQQALLAETPWSTLTDEQKVVFLVITADAEFLRVNLAGFIVSRITIAGVDDATQTELNLSATDASTAAADVTNLESSLRGNFSAWPRAIMVGPPHHGFTGNLRQNVPRWSMQVSTNLEAGTVQIDIDPFNPNSWAAPGHWFDVLWHRITRRDTVYKDVAVPLSKRGVKVAMNYGKN